MDKSAIYQMKNRFREIERSGLCIPFFYIEFEVHMGHSGGDLCLGSPKKPGETSVSLKLGNMSNCNGELR